MALGLDADGLVTVLQHVSKGEGREIELAVPRIEPGQGQQVIDEFVKKGQITVEQGKNLNSELTRKVKETFDATVSGASDSALRSRLESMTPEQRAEYAKKVADMSAAIDAERAGAAADAVAEDAPVAAEDVVEPDATE